MSTADKEAQQILDFVGCSDDKEAPRREISPDCSSVVRDILARIVPHLSLADEGVGPRFGWWWG